MIATLARSEYNSNQIERYIVQLESENMQIVQENEELRADFEYYTSPQYREKMAKQNQGKVNPGEKVLVLLDEKNEIGEDSEQSLVPDKVFEHKNLPQWKKWLKYFTRIDV